jgi:hypothetical protein
MNIFAALSPQKGKKLYFVPNAASAFLFPAFLLCHWSIYPSIHSSLDAGKSVNMYGTCHGRLSEQLSGIRISRSYRKSRIYFEAFHKESGCSAQESNQVAYLY